MEELRNIMQHQGLPIQQLERTSERVERGESYLLKSSSTLSVNMSHLKETAQIKSRILKELEQVQIKGGVNIKPLVREYISCINRLHKSTRVMLVPHFQKWNATFEKAILALHAKFGKDITGGGVIARDENGKGVESLYLVDDIKKKFDVLQQRNSCIARHEIQYISTE
jgi:hypothetical protein